MVKVLNKIIAIIENVIKIILGTWDKISDVQIKNVELLYKEDKFNILGKGSFDKAKVTAKVVSGEYPFQVIDDFVLEIALYDYSVLQKNKDVYEFGKNGIKLEDMHPIQQEEYVKNKETKKEKNEKEQKSVDDIDEKIYFFLKKKKKKKNFDKKNNNEKKKKKKKKKD